MRRLITLLLATLCLALPVLAQEKIALSVAEAEAATDPMTGQPVINVTLDADGTKKLTDFTAANIDRVVEIMVNDKVIIAPRIMSPLEGGAFVLSGSFTVSEADALAEVIGTASAPLFVRVQAEGKSK